MVAAMGREVIAVDAMADNLAYVKRSLEIQNREHFRNFEGTKYISTHSHLTFYKKNLSKVKRDNSSRYLNPWRHRAVKVAQSSIKSAKNCMNNHGMDNIVMDICKYVSGLLSSHLHL